MKHKLLTSLTILSLTLAGCTNDGGAKQTAGTYIGAAAGALLGSQVGKGHGRLAGVAVGTLIGAQLGAHIGQKMDKKDKELADQAAYQTLERQPDNVVSTWKNPNTQHRGDFVVNKTVETSSSVCREYTHTVYIDGEQEVLHGTACRNSSGKWVPSN